MILVDTSVWVDHLRAGDDALASFLKVGQVLMHPCVLGEIALGRLRRRDLILSDLRALPQIAVATDAEVLTFVERHRLFGLGIGWVDVHLLAAIQLTPGAFLWTRDKRLHNVSVQMGSAFSGR